MGDSTSEFRDALVGLIDSFPESGEHPSADRWLAYQRGALTADEEERLQEHLARCRDCCDLAEAAAAFAAADEAAAAAAAPDRAAPDQTESEELASAAVWRTLRPQLETSPGSPPDNVRAISSGAPRRDPSRLPLALAASFFVALLGLAAWTLHLWSLLDEARRPRANVTIVDFAAPERLSGPVEHTVIAGTGRWILSFHPVAELPAYRLTLRDTASGEELGTFPALPDDDLVLTLDVPDLPPGRYEIEITGKDGGEGEVQVLRVTEPGRGE